MGWFFFLSKTDPLSPYLCHVKFIYNIKIVTGFSQLVSYYTKVLCDRGVLGSLFMKK